MRDNILSVYGLVGRKPKTRYQLACELNSNWVTVNHYLRILKKLGLVVELEGETKKYVRSNRNGK